MEVFPSLTRKQNKKNIMEWVWGGGILYGYPCPEETTKIDFRENVETYAF